MAWNNTCLHSQAVLSGILEQLRRAALALMRLQAGRWQGSQWFGCLAGAGWLAWLLARGFGSSPWEPLQRAVWVSSWHSGQLALPRVSEPSRNKVKARMPLWSSLGSHIITSFTFYWSYNQSWHTVEIQGYKDLEVEITVESWRMAEVTVSLVITRTK